VETRSPVSSELCILEDFRKVTDLKNVRIREYRPCVKSIYVSPPPLVGATKNLGFRDRGMTLHSTNSHTEIHNIYTHIRSPRALRVYFTIRGEAKGLLDILHVRLDIIGFSLSLSSVRFSLSLSHNDCTTDWAHEFSSGGHPEYIDNKLHFYRGSSHFWVNFFFYHEPKFDQRVRKRIRKSAFCILCLILVQCILTIHTSIFWLNNV